MATKKGSNPLESWYENSIGSPSTTDEVYGYWMFVLGIVAGFVGIMLVMLSSSPGQNIRGAGIAMAALGLILLLAGPITRLPLQRMATITSYVGAAIGIVATVWFVVAFNAGNWGASFADSETLIIGLYGLGVLVITVGSVVTPFLTRTDREQMAAEKRAGEAETKRDAAMGKIARQEAHDEQRASEAEHKATMTEITRIKESQSQFELYTDQGGKYRWRLRHDNDNIIADSAQGYASRQGAQRGLSSVKRDAFGATVLDLDKIEREKDSHEDDAESDDSPPVTEDDGTQATFETYDDKDGKYRWRLRHDNDNIIADSSQGYVSRASRDDALESVRHYVQSADYLHIDPTAFELYRDEGGEYRWRLLHENGNILADSGQGYASRQGARQGVDSVQKNVAGDGDAEIEVYEDNAGEYRFRLVHRNDNIIADGSQGYASESGAREAVDHFREYAPEAHVLDIGSAAFEIYEDEGGDWRWRLRHHNGNIMADGSQGYASRTGAEDGLNSVKQNAPEATIEPVDS